MKGYEEDMSGSTKRESQPKKQRVGEQAPQRGAAARKVQQAEKTANGSPAATHGHRKAMQRLEDLCNNPEYGQELMTILQVSDPELRSQRLQMLVAEHHIDLFHATPLGQLIVNQTGADQMPALDLCQTVDELNELAMSPEGTHFIERPVPTEAKALSVLLYPVHIAISPLARKRDVLDYVAKRWPEIRRMMGFLGAGRPAIRPRRKTSRDGFIWAHRDMPSEELADLVDKEFPGESLTYADINSIKQKLKKRHSML
ncbi:MAG: hypothetical protein AB9886_01575 [Candidatus Cryosericum sp.]